MRERLQDIVIDENASIRDAMLAIARGRVEIALVVGDGGRLEGTVSDGDIRRALLDGASLDDPVLPHGGTEPLVVGPESGRAEVLDLMRARKLKQIPVLDTEGRLLGLHLIEEMIGGAERKNWAVIMAGGRGTRLAPFTDSLPKPMLTVAGRPILERLVLHLVGSGIRQIFITVNYRADHIEAHFGDGRDFGCQIEYVREDPEKPLGTAGSLALLAEEGHVPDCPVLIMNGDLVTQFSVERILLAHEQSSAAATVAVHNHAYTVPFGVVEADGDRLVRLAEKPTVSWRINAGIYVLEPHVLGDLPTGETISLPEVLQARLEAGEQVLVWEMDDEWIDVGHPHDLAGARGHL